MLILVISTFSVLVVSLLARKLWYTRRQQYAHFAQHPSALLLGHLKVVGQFARLHKHDAHADLALVDMSKALGRPPLMFVDLRPISEPVVVVADHEIADAITKASKSFPTSPPKSDGSLQRLLYLMGPASIFSQHGDQWKLLRKQFNPGFAPQYLNTFVPEILDKGLIFAERLDSLCKSGKVFSMMSLTVQLTFDIIGRVIMETDLDAQDEDETKRGELVVLFETLLKAYQGERFNLPWWLTPGKVARRSALFNRITGILQEVVRRKHAEVHKTGVAASEARSVLSLALLDTKQLTPDAMNTTCDQLRTFLFAGHDTTAILLSWVFYELSRTPHASHAVQLELNSLFGADTKPDAVRAQMLERSDRIQQMPYISAVIKEALRLHPPGGTARAIPRGSGFTVRMPNSDPQCLDGLLVYNCQRLIHTDPKVFGDTAYKFMPERWLTNKDSDNIAAGAWRPFERGPRSCIGQELANIEARIIIALVFRRYKFNKVGLGKISRDNHGQPVLNDQTSQYNVSEELYPTRQVTSKPVDGMMMSIESA
ncbi:cytochrome P450 [Astrocystis sublimbata]|nr:cytochrome P450 [Astrocystis sublimbata]